MFLMPGSRARILPAASVVLQVLQTTYTTNTSLTTTLPIDDTTPLSTEGTQVLSQAITPAASTNKILVLVSLFGGPDFGSQPFIGAAVFRGATCINATVAMGGDDTGAGTNSYANNLVMSFLDSPATTSATTYTVRVGTSGAAQVRLNGTIGGRLFGGTAACTLTLIEVRA